MSFLKIFLKIPALAVLALTLILGAAQGAEIGAADPANVGKTMEAIRKEIADLERKGSELTDADKAVIADYQKVLEFDEKIQRFQMWRTGMQGLRDKNKLFLEDATGALGGAQLMDIERGV